METTNFPTPEIKIDHDDGSVVVWGLSPHGWDGCLRSVREVTFLPNGTIECRHLTSYDGTVFHWSWTKAVGSYDDWQIREEVVEAAKLAGIDISGVEWYRDNPGTVE